MVEYMNADLEVVGSSRARNLLTKQEDNTYHSKFRTTVYTHHDSCVCTKFSTAILFLVIHSCMCRTTTDTAVVQLYTVDTASTAIILHNNIFILVLEVPYTGTV